MGVVAAYAYLNARVSAMAGRLLSPAALEALVQQSYDDVVESCHMGGGALDIPVEQQLMSMLLADFAVLARPLSGQPRDFLLYWGHRFELGNLKALIRGKVTGQPVAEIRAGLVELGAFSTLPLEELLRTEDIAELLRRLDRTPYADIARQAKSVFEERRDLFTLDAALDRHYFEGLATRAKAFSGQDGAPLRELTGNVIDRVNLAWLLRYRFSYHLPPAQAYYLLVPAGRYLSSKQLLELSRLGSFEEVILALPQPFAELLEGTRNAIQVTQLLERESARVAEFVLKHTVFNLARAVAYLMLRERDLRGVRVVVKGKQLKLGTGLIRAALGLPASAAVS